MSLPPEVSPSRLSAERAFALIQQGQTCLKTGDFPGAADAAQALLKYDFRSVEGWVLLCSALIRMGSVDDDRALADALGAIPVTHPAHSLLAVERCRVLANRGRCGEAVELARMVEAHVRLSPRQHDILSNTYTTCGLFDEAYRHSLLAAKGLPEDAAVIYNKALSLRNLGRIDEAVADFSRVVEKWPNHALGFFSLADSKRWSIEENHVAQIETALQSGQATEEDLPRLNYALFKEAHDIGDHPKAWSALTTGARLAHARAPYQLQDRKAYTDALIRFFNDEMPGRAPDGPAPIPIFIVGLPRSGTTLVERIFSAHPEVTDMGETHGFALAVRDSLGVPRFGDLDAGIVNQFARADWQKVAENYLRSLAYRKPETRFFTEKLPHNYHLVGAMKRAFPHARIVHLRRAPMDSLFGAYKVLFGQGSYLWSYRFEDLAAAYKMYRKLTDHWRAILGEGFTEVILEQLIAEPEPRIRELLERTGLDFHPDCLSPHQASGGVSTASSTQVRQPINSQGVGAWRKYADGFEPLRKLLEADGFVDAEGNPIW
jgi:tetratricopeptide (TPR) repeat protein